MDIDIHIRIYILSQGHEITPRSELAHIDELGTYYPPVDDDPSRKDVILVPRPPIQHIKAPVGFKASDHDEPDVVVRTGHYKKLHREVMAAQDVGCENSLLPTYPCRNGIADKY